MNLFSKLFGPKQKYDDLPEDSEVYDTPVKQEVDFLDGFSESVKNNNEEFVLENLPEAIRYVVDKWGKDYLLDRGFINVLNDFKVLKDIPAAKHIFTNMQANGYIDRVLQANNWELDSLSITKQYANEFGANEAIVS